MTLAPELPGMQKVIARAVGRHPSPELVARLTHLVEVVKLEPTIVQKWLDKADAMSFAEMPADAVRKCVAFVEAKLNPGANHAAL